MKMKTMKKIAMLLLAVMVITLGMPAMTVRADYPASTDTGTITITKYVSESGSSTWGDYDANDSYTQETGVEPLGGVTFTIRKVGTISQQATDGTVQILYTIDSDVATALGVTSPCSSTELDAALQGLANPQATAETLVQTGTIQSGTTAAEGTSIGTYTFSDLAQGLYLVVETDAPADVTSKSVPFFVSIPSYYTEGDTSDWTLNVNAYPKNTVGTADITKKIVNEDNDEVDTINANVNDTINFKIDFTAPIPDGGLEQLYIIDTLSKGLTYDAGSLKVYQASDDTEISSDYYTVENTDGDGDSHNETLKVTFDATNYLANLTGTEVSFYITYTCTLNENAVLGQTGNTNSVDLYYSNDSTEDMEDNPSVEGEDTPTVYTYGIQITKEGTSDNGATTLSDVEFELKNGDNVVATGKTDSNGILSFRGIEPGTYTITETKTQSGYVLLKDPITITITQTDATTGVAEATVTTGTAGTTTNDSVNMINDTKNTDSATAIVPITVVNEQGFDLPTTGASGTAIFAFVGIILVIVAGVLLIIRKKQ